MCNDEYRELADGLTTALADRGIELLAAHVVDRVAAGGRWHCADGCGNAGTVDDPSASPLAVAAVLDGRRLYARRAELQEVIEVTDPARERRAGRGRSAAANRIGGASGRRGARRHRGGHGRGGAGGRRRGTRRRRTGPAGVGADRPSGARHPLRAGGGRERRAGRGAVGRAVAHPAGAVAGRGAGAAGVLGLRPRRRPAGRGVAGGGAALRPDAPDGGHARHRAAVGDAARTDP